MKSATAKKHGAKKAAAKKTVTRKSPAHKATKARATKGKSAPSVTFCFPGNEASDDKCFWVNNGPVVRNITELRHALEDMTDDQFGYHAMDRGINDFSKWIEDVLGHNVCARNVSRAKSRHEALKALAVCEDK